MRSLRVYFVKAVAILVAFLLGALVVLLAACGVKPKADPGQPLNFVVIVANKTNSPERITIRSALGGLYLTSAEQTVPAYGEAAWVLGVVRPDLIEIQSLALNTGWGPPDWRGAAVLKISYPDGFTETQQWPSAPEERTR